MSSVRLDLTGKKFGKLQVIGTKPIYDGRNCLWECKCDCGILKTIRAGQLNQGRTKSCEKPKT